MLIYIEALCVCWIQWMMGSMDDCNCDSCNVTLLCNLLKACYCIGWFDLRDMIVVLHFQPRSHWGQFAVKVTLYKAFKSYFLLWIFRLMHQTLVPLLRSFLSFKHKLDKWLSSPWTAFYSNYLVLNKTPTLFITDSIHSPCCAGVEVQISAIDLSNPGLKQ